MSNKFIEDTQKEINKFLIHAQEDEEFAKLLNSTNSMNLFMNGMSYIFKAIEIHDGIDNPAPKNYWSWPKENWKPKDTFYANVVRAVALIALSFERSK